jgi:hypothetical protein
VTQAWRDTIRSSDQSFVETAHLLDADGRDDLELKIVSGSVTEDATRSVRTDFNLTVIAEVAAADLPGQRVRIRRGFLYPGETEPELVTLCTGWIAKADVQSGSGTIALSGMDRSSRLQRPSLKPVTIPAGRNAALAVRDLLSTVDPSLEWDAMETDWTLPRLTYAADQDLWGEGIKLALSFGAEVFVDRDDHVRLRPVATAEPPERYTFTEGDDGTVLDGSQGWDIDQTYNGVIGVSQHSSLAQPLRAEAWQAGVDADSPDARPYRFTTEKAATQGQLQVMVNAQLQLVVGGSHEVNVTAVQDASLEADDVARMSLGSIGAEDLFVTTRVGFTLAAAGSGMEVVARAGVASE